MFDPGLAAIWFALFLDSLSAEREGLGTFHSSTSRGSFREGILSERDFYQGCLVLFLSSKNNRLLPSAV